MFESHGMPHRLTLPSRRFHRHVGSFANVYTDPDGRIIGKEEFEAERDGWLPSASDRAYTTNIMQKPVYDAKQMANWIAPPKQGIKGRPVAFEYVRREA